MRRFALWMALVLVLAACGAPSSTATPAGAENPSAPPASPTVAAPTQPPVAQATSAEAISQQPTPEPPAATPGTDGPRVLAWNPNVPELAWYSSAGADALASGTARALAIPCAEQGDQLVAHLGGESSGRQELYDLTSADVRELESGSGLTCSLRGGVQFSPNGTRVALLLYPANVIRAEFTAGRLRILSLPDRGELAALENVHTFSLSDEGVLYLQFSPNTRGEAGVADLLWWDGSASRRVEQDIRPLENCVFVSGRVLRLGDRVYTLFGERCGRATNWRLMQSDFAGGNSQNIVQAAAGGAYFNNAATNALWPMPNSGEVLIAYPNGLASDVANLARINLADGTVTPVLNGVVTEAHPPSTPRRLLFAPQGNRLALITRDGNSVERLYVYRLDAPDTAPEVLAGGNRGDRIPAIVWATDGSRLFYILTGDINGIYGLTFGEQTSSTLVARGVFQGLVITPDGTLLSASKQNQVGTNDVRNNLVQIVTADGRETVLVEGRRGESALVPLAIR